jgi:hypothetical protein
MSDESSRSARPYGQRRNDGAPTWWAALDRSDLPDSEGVPAAHRRWYEETEVAVPETGVTVQSAHSRWRNWGIGALVALAVAIILAIAWGLGGTEQVLVTLVIGVPVVLAVVTTVIVAGRSR